MDSREIERRLRLPALDEPAVLPALALPPQVPRPGVRVRLRTANAGTPTSLLTPRLAFAILALVLAMVAAIMAGALRLDWLRNPLDPFRSFSDQRIQLEYPSSWVRLTPDDLSNQTASTALLVSSVGVEGCEPADVASMAEPTPVISGTDVEFVDGQGTISNVGDRILACMIGRPLAPGEIRVAVTAGIPQRIGVGPIESFDPTAWFGPDARPDTVAFAPVPTLEDGWDRLIDGMPAKLVITAGSPAVGSDEVRTWAVYEPGNSFEPWFIRAYLRGPTLDGLRQQADAVAMSIRFVARPVELDVARRDELVAAAIDQVDRDLRSYPGSRFYGCFPHAAGSRDVLLQDGPGGPLLAPVPATCTTSAAEPTLLRMWRVTLTVSWPAGDGYPAGELSNDLLIDPEAQGAISQGGFPREPGFSFPGSTGPLPPPLTGELAFPAGSLVRVLSPGVSQSWSAEDNPVRAFWARSIEEISASADAPLMDRLLGDIAPGTRLYVVGGPHAAVGTDWYLVEYDFGAAGPGDLGWAPASWNGRPLLEIVPPACPAAEPSVADLVYLEPAERLLCFGSRELTLAPAIAATTDIVGAQAPGGEPAWLDAWASQWRLHGTDGPDGVDPPLTIAISPELGESIPTGTWLTVRGHFDDPASAGCGSKYAESSGGIVEWSEFQELVCRELFVVTGYEERGAP